MPKYACKYALKKGKICTNICTIRTKYVPIYAHCSQKTKKNFNSNIIFLSFLQQTCDVSTSTDVTGQDLKFGAISAETSSGKVCPMPLINA